MIIKLIVMIEEAIKNLEKLSGFQFSIQLDKKLMNEFGCDGIISYRRAEENHYMRVILKSEVTSPGNLLMDSVMRLDMIQPKETMIVSNYISREMKQYLVGKGFHFLETVGNCHIAQEDVYLHISGLSTAPYRRNLDSISSGLAGMKVIHSFLQNPELLNSSYRKIARHANVSIGSIGLIIGYLEEHGHIKVYDSYRLLDRPTELLVSWLDNYKNTLFEKYYLGRYSTSNNAIEGEGITTRNICFESSNYGTVVYLSTRKQIEDLDLQKDDKGDIYVIEKFWKDDVSSSDGLSISSIADMLSLLTIDDFADDEQEILTKGLEVLMRKVKQQVVDEVMMEIRRLQDLEQRKNTQLLMNKKEAAQTLGLSVSTIDNLRRRGELHGKKIGSRVLFEAEEIERYRDSL